jgi:large subunit ribosomal protein L15
MNITEITNRASRNRARKRVGRGEGSGHGKTSGRGNKGAGARAGRKHKILYEGGAFPLFRRLPKIGFSNFAFRTTYQVVNVSDLEARFDAGGHVTAASLFEAGLIRDALGPVKILGDGELKKKLAIEAQRFSAEAQKKIEAAGGTVKKLGPQPKKKFIKRPPPKPVKGEAEEAGPEEKKGKKAEKGEKAEKAARPEGKSGGKKARPEAQEGGAAE